MDSNALDKLRVFQVGRQAASEVFALAEASSLGRDFNLRSQLQRSAASVPAQIAEGFGQKTDRHFASYLYMARGGCNEVRSHIELACERRLILPEQRDRILEIYDHEGRMLTRLIQHLERSDLKRRG